MRKKIVAINSDHVFAKTGLGRNAKELVKYLLPLDKYEIVYYASGMQWGNGDFSSLPFKCHGALPDNPQELQELQRDQLKMRDAAYGGANIERFIREVRPDVMIFSNDSWAFPYCKKPWWDKFGCILHVTLDSLPFLPDQIDQIKNSKHFRVWSDFAQKESEKLGCNHVKTLTGMINRESFQRLNEHARIQLRFKNNIPIDAFVVGFVFRSQLRKELRPLMEGFSMFKRQNPEVRNPRLLLHTNFSEGWDIPRMAREFDIDPKEILTTYICRNCNNHEFRPFSGQDCDCRFCGAQKSQVTCNVVNGVEEKSLNEVYNLMDCYCHLMNAGGLEIPIVEALYAGLPVATVGYSSGEMFTEQPFVYPIDFSWSVQFGTQFKRACPSAYSVSKFLKKIHAMSVKDRIELGRKGAEWAVKTFSPEVVGKQWEELIDSIPFTDYDFNFSYKPKNSSFPFPEIEQDSDFITALYKNILDMDELPSGEGHKHWAQILKNGGKRRDVYAYFIKVAEDENRKNTSVPLRELFENNGRKRALFVLKESIGDHFIFTSFCKSMSEKYPDYDIYIAADPKYHEVYAGNPHIKRVIPYLPIMENELNFIGAGSNEKLVDVYSNVGVPTQRILNYLSNGYLPSPESKVPVGIPAS